MADSSIFAIEKLIRDNGEKLTDDDKKVLQAAVDKLKGEMKSDDVDALKRAIEDFGKSTQAIVMKLYQNAQGGAAGGDCGSKCGDDEVIVE
jgi:molecular chaperone DnaK